MTVDPEQRNCKIVGLGGGQFLTIGADGQVSWWHHLAWQTGDATWANNGSAKVIGGGFAGYLDVMGGLDGSLLCRDSYGHIDRYRYVVTDSNTGAGSWENGGSPVRVGTGFDRFARVFGGPDGVIWAIDTNGDLWQSTYTNGTMSTPVKVGGGWREPDWCGADSGGVIYAVRHGVLVWFRYTGGAWVNGGNLIQIGDGGWGDMFNRALCAAGGGLFYWVALDRSNPPGSDNQLGWLYLTNYQTVAADGGGRWANNASSRVVGSGFTAEPWSALQGYCWPQSVAPGGTVGAKVSTTLGTLHAEVRQLAPNATPTVVATLPDITGTLQLLPSGYRQAGCGWADSATVAVPASGWPSGVYCVRVTDPDGGLHRDLPFVVHPTSPAAPVAVVLPWLTYSAYNAWAGHDQYTPGPNALRTVTLQRPSYKHTTEDGGAKDCELYSDLLLLRWLSAHGFTYDVYTDLDLHADPCLLGSYRAVVLGSHPEYASDAMRPAYARHVAHGGRLVYTGGNGLYERVTINDGLTAVTWRRTDGARDVFRDHGQTESQILGVDYNGDGWMTRAPYKVVHDHPILVNTGLAVGSLFGAAGLNGAASGIEYDTAPAGGAGTVIAVGTNTATTGANMTWTDKPGGGWVFAAGSLTFNGALGHDPALDQLFRNVMDRAIA